MGELKGKIIDFEPYRVEKELEQFKDYDEKNFLQIVMLVTSAKIQTVTELYV